MRFLPFKLFWGKTLHGRAHENQQHPDTAMPEERLEALDNKWVVEICPPDAGLKAVPSNENLLKGFIRLLDKHQSQTSMNICRKFSDFSFVLLWQYDCASSGIAKRSDFLRQAPTPKMFPCSVISPVTATSFRTFRCVRAEMIPIAKQARPMVLLWEHLLGEPVSRDRIHRGIQSRSEAIYADGHKFIGGLAGLFHRFAHRTQAIKSSMPFCASTSMSWSVPAVSLLQQVLPQTTYLR